MRELFKYLLDTFSIPSTSVIPWQEKDDSGNVKSVKLFIPFRLVTEHNIKVADLQPLLPEGWVAKESKRTEDMQAAITEGLQYTYSIAIEERVNAEDVINAYLSK